MRVLLLADYPAGVAITRFLSSSAGDEIVGMVMPPPRMANALNQGCAEEIRRIANLPGDRVFTADDVQSGACLDRIRALNPDVALLIFWGLLVRPEFIAIPPVGCINLHLSYLPFNRGKNPNVWPIVEGTPAGVTLHFVNAAVDAGDIVAQSEIPVEPIDTGATLYDKLVAEAGELFRRTWPAISAGRVRATPQDDGRATFHYGRDLRSLDRIDLDRQYTGRELLDLIRSRTFAPFPSAYFVEPSGRRVYVRLALEYGEADAAGTRTP